MKYKKRAGHAVLLHEVLPLINLTELELLQQKFLDLFILDQRREGKVRLKTLQDECLIIDSLLLNNLDKVLIDLVIVDGT